VFEAARAGGAGKITQESLTQVLKPVAAKLKIEFWDSKSGEAGKVGTNNKAVRSLSDTILKNIQPGMLSTSLL
jgi:hypothetical protein